MTKRCSRISPSSRHRYSWIQLLFTFANYFITIFFRHTNVEFVIICLSRCSKSQRINEFGSGEEKKQHPCIISWKVILIWYAMFFFCFQHFSFPFYITIVQREKKSGNQRKREKQKKSSDRKEKNQTMQMKAVISWTKKKPNAISYLCHCYSTNVRSIFFQFFNSFFSLMSLRKL